MGWGAAVRIELTDAERSELQARARRRKIARADAMRAEIILLAADGTRYRDVEQAIFWGEPCSTVVMVPTCSLRSRTRRAAFGGGLWPSLTFAAPAGLPKGRSGRRDVSFRSNNRMPSGRCRSQPGNDAAGYAKLFALLGQGP